MTDPYIKAGGRGQAASSPNRSATEPANVLLQLALVVCRLVLVNDTFRSKSIKNGFYLRQLSLRLRRVGRVPQLLHERAHLAPMGTITHTPLGILAYPLGG